MRLCLHTQHRQTTEATRAHMSHFFIFLKFTSRDCSALCWLNVNKCILVYVCTSIANMYIPLPDLPLYLYLVYMGRWRSDRSETIVGAPFLPQHVTRFSLLERQFLCHTPNQYLVHFRINKLYPGTRKRRHALDGATFVQHTHTHT